MDRQNATARRDIGNEDDLTETLGRGESDHLEYIREYATQVVRGSQWPLRGVELSAISFEIRHRAQRRHGVAVYDSDGDSDRGGDGSEFGDAGSEATRVTIGISIHNRERPS